MKPEYSQKFLQRRRFITVLPLIIVPFVTVVFWLLGGGTAVGEKTAAAKGLNTQLPDAKFGAGSLQDKMSFYAMADRDSIRKEEQVRMDPNLNSIEIPEQDQKVFNQETYKVKKERSLPAISYELPEESLPRRLGEVEQLQGYVQAMQNKQPDPEMEALNGALDKLLAIQQPQRANEKPKVVNKKLYAVNVNPVSGDPDFFGAGDSAAKGRFYSESYTIQDTLLSHFIPAMVQGTQTLQPGSVIKLRSLKDAYVGGEKIPAGSFLFGSVSIDNERLRIEITGIVCGAKVYAVSLIVFDADGIEGIFIPGSGSREVVKQSTDQGVQSLGIISMDPSIKAQVSAAAVGAAKSLLSKKVKQVRVTVKSGYKVLLQDTNDKTFN